MSFSVSFFARDVHAARNKLREVHAPNAVKALVELAIASIPVQPPGQGAGSRPMTVAEADHKLEGLNRAAPAPQPRLCGILVDTHGHIDEYGGRSAINAFRVEPYYD